VQVGAVDEVGVVRDHRDVRVDHGVLPAEHLDPGAGDLDRRAGRDDLGRHAAELLLRSGIDDQARLRVRVEQRSDPFGVEVVGVLMRDEHRVQPADRLEPRREGPGVE
jgi:hypothetical protein